MEALPMSLSFSVSMCSAVFTFYFWIMKARMERQKLKTYAAEPHVGGHAFSSHGDTIKLIFEPKLIVANYSSLPNALLGVRAWLATREGGWILAKATLDASTPLPINISPMQTVPLNLTATVDLPAIPEGEECRNTNATFRLYRERCFPQDLEIKLELTALCEKRFKQVVRYAPKEAADVSLKLRIAA
jgi:hypothetical protein